MFARYVAIRRRLADDCCGITSIEYAVLAAAVVGALLLPAQNFMTALSSIIDSFAAAL